MATVRAQLQEARDNAQEIENELERANEAVEILSNQLEEVADYVETEVRRIVESLEKNDVGPHERIYEAIVSLKRLVEAI